MFGQYTSNPAERSDETNPMTTAERVGWSLQSFGSRFWSGMIFWVGSGRFTLPETNIALENPPFSWYLPVNLGIFYGYVSLTEGTKSHVLGGFFRSYGGGQEFFFCFDSPPGPKKTGAGNDLRNRSIICDSILFFQIGWFNQNLVLFLAKMRFWIKRRLQHAPIEIAL